MRVVCSHCATVLVPRPALAWRPALAYTTVLLAHSFPHVAMLRSQHTGTSDMDAHDAVGKKQAHKRLMANPWWGPPVKAHKSGTVCNECKMEGLYEVLCREAKKAAEAYNALVPEDATNEEEYPPALQKIEQMLTDLGGPELTVEEDTYKLDLEVVQDCIDSIDKDQHEDWKELIDLFEYAPKDCKWKGIVPRVTRKYKYVDIEGHEARTGHDRDPLESSAAVRGVSVEKHSTSLAHFAARSSCVVYECSSLRVSETLVS